MLTLLSLVLCPPGACPPLRFCLTRLCTREPGLPQRPRKQSGGMCPRETTPLPLLPPVSLLCLPLAFLSLGEAPGQGVLSTEKVFHGRHPEWEWGRPAWIRDRPCPPTVPSGGPFPSSLPSPHCQHCWWH